MAAHVVAACAPLPVAVVCDDEDVAQWASEVGATVMWEPGQGLNGAVRAGVDRLARAGARWVTVAHGDLPRAHGLGVLAPFDGVTLVPDRRDDGTNVLRLPAGSDFRFAYGPGSFRAHRAEATRLGLPVRVLRHPGLGLRRRLARRRRRAQPDVLIGPRTRSRGPEGPRSRVFPKERSA